MNQWLKTSVGRRSDVPAQSGVYVFAVNAGFRRSVIYVGQAKNLQERINQHFSSSEDNFDLKAYVRRYPNELEIYWMMAPYGSTLDSLEYYLFQYYRPTCNKNTPPTNVAIRCPLPV